MAVVSSQVCRGRVLLPEDAGPAAPRQARQRGHREQGSRSVPAVKPVIAERLGQRSDDRSVQHLDHLQVEGPDMRRPALADQPDRGLVMKPRSRLRQLAVGPQA